MVNAVVLIQCEIDAITEAAEAIRRFHDRELDGRKLVVNEADARPPRRPDAFAAPRGPSAPPPPR